MPLGYNNDDGAQALDQQQEIDFRRGWQVVDAASGSNLVTSGTGTYEVDVAAGDINTPTGTVTCSAATLDLQSLVDPDLPRIVIVYRDASGVAQTLAGTPAAKQPTGETAPGPIYQPAPDAFSTTDGVVLATVLLEAAASSVGSGQIRDRRMPASLNVDSAEVGSLKAEVLNNARQILPSDSHADIESKLSSSGTVVWTEGDYTSLPDRVEITASDIDLYITEGAHIAVADDASPTLVQADNRTSPDGQWLFILWNNGYDNVDIHNFGLIEGRRWGDPANKSNVIREYVACVGVHNATNSSLYNHGSDLFNTAVGASYVDCTHFEIVDPFSSVLRESPAELEGCEHFQVRGSRTIGSNEGVNLNAYNQYYHVSGIVADGDGADNTTGIEIEESPNGTVSGIEARNGCDKVALINGRKDRSGTNVTDPKFTDKTATGNCNNVTLKDANGEVSAVPISVSSNGNPCQDITVDANVVSTGDRAIHLLSDADNVFDGMELRGRYETTATGRRAAYLNNGEQQMDGLTLNDATFVGTDTRVELDAWDHVTGSIEVEGVRFLVFAETGYTCENHDLNVTVHDSDGRGLHLNANGALSDNTYRGRADNNSSNDITIDEGTDITLDMEYGSRFVSSSTTRVAVNNLGYNAGDPNSTGDWNGNGYEGVQVRDTTNANTYLYNDGSWSQIASA